jgi:hypothetical protein
MVPIRGFFRLIPTFLRAVGAKITTIEVNHRPRLKGKTKYLLTKLYFLPTIFDLLFVWWYSKTCLIKHCHEKSSS